jgi:hypothetical protein
MKKALMVLVAVMLMMGLATGANAAFVQEATYTLTNSTVQFYLVDWDDNSTITMTATIPWGSIGNLQYKFDNTTWSGFTGTGISGTATINLPISPSPTQARLMYLRYGSDVTANSMIFQGWTTNSGVNTIPQSLDLFTGLIVNFDGTDYTTITFASNSAPDMFAPVPISPSVYLLGAGLLGLVGLRRRFQQ